MRDTETNGYPRGYPSMPTLTHARALLHPSARTGVPVRNVCHRLCVDTPRGIVQTSERNPLTTQALTAASFEQVLACIGGLDMEHVRAKVADSQAASAAS